MLEAVVGALSFLHENKVLSMEVFQPSNILAVGDRIKLSCDCVSYAGSPADDVRALGVTLVQSVDDPAQAQSANARELSPALLRHRYACLKPDPQSPLEYPAIARCVEPEAPADKNPRRMAVLFDVDSDHGAGPSYPSC